MFLGGKQSSKSSDETSLNPPTVNMGMDITGMVDKSQIFNALLM